MPRFDNNFNCDSLEEQFKIKRSNRVISSVSGIRIIRGDSNKEAFSGGPITRTKHSHPYSYEPFYVYQLDGKLSEEMTKGRVCAYNDRMQQWDALKYERACKVLDSGAYSFSNQSIEALTRFVQVYSEDDHAVFLGLIEGCNVGNGYPYWVFEWYSSKT
jgi:hypothetical protein